MSDDVSALDGALAGEQSATAVDAAVTTDASEYTRSASSYPVYSDRTDVYDKLDDREGDTSDDVDPRRLVEDPTPSEIRWYYRNSPFAPTLVDKPVDDAFKHGYELDFDGGTLPEDLRDVIRRWEPHRKRARKTARRDGFAFIFVQFDDASDAAKPPSDVTGVDGFEVLDIGELASDPDEKGMSEREIAEHVKYRREQLRILPQGVVAVEDISSPDHHDIVGVIKDVPQSDATRTPPNSDGAYRFLHADRLQHFVENPEVDGPLHANWVGSVTGHPVLGPVFHELKGLSKTSWAVGQTLYRHSAPLHVIEIEEKLADAIDDTEQHIEDLNKQTRNINAASSLTLPPGHEMNAVSNGSDLDPAVYVETLIEMLCAGSEFTKTVLMGTQSGTVSGSESDIKNYFNQVQRYRQTDAVDALRGFVDMLRQHATDSLVPNVVGNGASALSVDWGPLFKIDELDTTEAMTRVMTAVTNGIQNYVLSLEDAQRVVEQQWAELGADVSLDELSEDEKDELDRVNSTISERSKQEQEAGAFEGNPEVGQNNGGPEKGETREQSNPTSDDLEALVGAL